MIYEVYKKWAEKYGCIDGAIKKGFCIIWDSERIKKAFNNGNGKKDFNRYKKDNSKYCYFITR